MASESRPTRAGPCTALCLPSLKPCIISVRAADNASRSSIATSGSIAAGGAACPSTVPAQCFGDPLGGEPDRIGSAAGLIDRPLERSRRGARRRQSMRAPAQREQAFRQRRDIVHAAGRRTSRAILVGRVDSISNRTDPAIRDGDVDRDRSRIDPTRHGSDRHIRSRTKVRPGECRAWIAELRAIRSALSSRRWLIEHMDTISAVLRSKRARSARRSGA